MPMPPCAQPHGNNLVQVLEANIDRCHEFVTFFDSVLENRVPYENRVTELAVFMVYL